MWITIGHCKYGTGYSVCFFRLSTAGLHWKQKCISPTELLWELLSQWFTSFVLWKDKASEKKNMWYFNKNVSELQGRWVVAHRGQTAWRCSGATSIMSSAPLILAASSSNSPASAGGSVLPSSLHRAPSLGIEMHLKTSQQAYHTPLATRICQGIDPWSNRSMNIYRSVIKRHILLCRNFCSHNTPTGGAGPSPRAFRHGMGFRHTTLRSWSGEKTLLS